MKKALIVLAKVFLCIFYTVASYKIFYEKYVSTYLIDGILDWKEYFSSILYFMSIFLLAHISVEFIIRKKPPRQARQKKPKSPATNREPEIEIQPPDATSTRRNKVSDIISANGDQEIEIDIGGLKKKKRPI